MPGLAAHVLAVATVQALLGRTFAGSDVYLEPMHAIDMDAKASPVICIYAGHGETAITGNNLLSATGGLRLRFEFLLPAEVVVTLAGQQVIVDAGEGYSVLFAALWRQVEIVLTTGQTPWAEVFRDFRLQYTGLELASELFEYPGKKGNLVPARAVELIVDPLADPPVGKAPAGVWQRFLDAVRADAGDIKGLAPFYEALIVGGDTLAQWRVDQSILGERTAAMRAIRVAPPTTPEEADQDLQPPPYGLTAPADPDADSAP